MCLSINIDSRDVKNRDIHEIKLLEKTISENTHQKMDKKIILRSMIFERI